MLMTAPYGQTGLTPMTFQDLGQAPQITFQGLGAFDPGQLSCTPGKTGLVCRGATSGVASSLADLQRAVNALLAAYRDWFHTDVSGLMLGVDGAVGDKTVESVRWLLINQNISDAVPSDIASSPWFPVVSTLAQLLSAETIARYAQELTSYFDGVTRTIRDTIAFFAQRQSARDRGLPVPSLQEWMQSRGKTGGEAEAAFHIQQAEGPVKQPEPPTPKGETKWGLWLAIAAAVVVVGGTATYLVMRRK